MEAIALERLTWMTEIAGAFREQQTDDTAVQPTPWLM